MRASQKKFAFRTCGALLVIFGFSFCSLYWTDRYSRQNVASPNQCLSDEYNPYRAKLARGVFIVASRQLRDPNFSQTVVILLEYSSEGAVGLIVNRPSEVRVSKILPEIKALRKKRDTLYFGGPVGVDQILLLIRSDRKPEESYLVFEDVYVCASLEVLERIVERRDGGDSFRTYAGYAGWAAGQLDFEVARGDWHVITADATSVFSKNPEDVWPRLIEKSTAQWTRFLPYGREKVPEPMGDALHNG
jgi:putative transcriptional regulator